jgi:hypothetical protein
MTERPGYPSSDILRGLSLPRRVGYVVAGLGGLAGAVMIGVLWATEPAELPARTQIAFAAMMAVGAVWAAFAAWALIRRPLFAIDRVIAAALAVVFSALTTVGAVVVSLVRSSTAGLAAAAGLGLPLVAVAVALLMRARTHRVTLLARRREVEASLASSHQDSDTHDHSGTSRLPLGPLAVAMRHRRDGGGSRRFAIAALILGLALVAGLALLLR